MGLGSVCDPGLGGGQRTGRLLAHKRHEHSLAGALTLPQEYSHLQFRRAWGGYLLKTFMLLDTNPA